MTNEELDAARAKEAERRWDEATEGGTRPTWVPLGVIAARLARENWTPPEPVVDPDLAAFREWESAQWPAYTCTQAAYLAGARMAREREQERAKVLVDRLSDLVERVTHDGKRDYVTGVNAGEMISARVTLARYRGEA